MRQAHPIPRGVGLIFLLALGVAGWPSQVRSAEDEDHKKAVARLTADVASGKTIPTAEAEQFAKRWDDLEEVKKDAFKPRKGFSLEWILIRLAPKTTHTAEQKANLVQIANLSRTLAVVLPHYFVNRRPITKEVWDRYCREMDGWSVDLLEGVKAGDGKAISRAATKLTQTCTDCHNAIWLPGPRVVKRPTPVTLVGRATDYWYKRSWSGSYSREDFTLRLKDEKTGKTWRILSREPTPAYDLRMGPTCTGLKVDWKAKPRVKVVGVEGVDRIPAKFYDFELNDPPLATALVVSVETKAGEWKDFYVNNWFHRWSDEADKQMAGLFAGKPAPYDVYGYVKGQAAPFDKRSRAVLDKHKDNPSLLFHGRIREAKKEPFGYEIELIDLIGRDVRTGGRLLLHGDAKSIPRLDTHKPE